MTRNIEIRISKFRLLLPLCFLLGTFYVISQEIPPEFSQKMWKAVWVTVPDTDGEAYGIYLFRKQIELDKEPAAFPIYISADNQYELYVNGKLVARGPTKGDETHWYYESLDLAAFMKAGINTIAAKVWNEGEHRREAQRSNITALIIQGVTEAASIMNTDQSWKCIQDPSYSPILISTYGPSPGKIGLPGYYVAGPGEKVDMSKKISLWQSTSFNDSKWDKAKVIFPGIPRNTVGLDAGNSWRLLPSSLPQMQLEPQRFNAVHHAAEMKAPAGFPEKAGPLSLPANTKTTFLLDQGYLTNAFPTLSYSKGNGTIISLTYAPALYEEGYKKGNRNEIEGKTILGRMDSIISNGNANQNFSPLSYRTFRFVQVEISTKDEPLLIHDIYSTAVGYPFQMNAKLETPLPEMEKMMEIGWRTARLCAMDSYMDCPFWEQLQYIGDTRIQAMVSLYNSGDDRLVKHALDLMDFSRQPDGITLSRYPTNNIQIITPFSLWYIGMLKDYMMYGSDIGFVQKKLSGSRQILQYFEEFQNASGSLRNLPAWAFTDWVDQWQRGMPPYGKDGSSALLDLQLLMAFQNAQALEKNLGMEAFSDQYEMKIKQLTNTIKEQYWDESKNLFADNTNKDTYSQHANSMAILTGLVSQEKASAMGNQIANDKALTQASIYFRYYVHLALVKAGLGNDYLDWLDIWRDHMKAGLTTWAEDTDANTTRSDCHAWGSSPNIEFFRTILGIDSASPNFKTVKIEPHLGDIKNIGGVMPHPNGKIAVSYDLDKKREANIDLPSGIHGNFIWNGKTYKLNSGENKIEL